MYNSYLFMLLTWLADRVSAPLPKCAADGQRFVLCPQARPGGGQGFTSTQHNKLSSCSAEPTFPACGCPAGHARFEPPGGLSRQQMSCVMALIKGLNPGTPMAQSMDAAGRAGARAQQLTAPPPPWPACQTPCPAQGGGGQHALRAGAAVWRWQRGRRGCGVAADRPGARRRRCVPRLAVPALSRAC